MKFLFFTENGDLKKDPRFPNNLPNISNGLLSEFSNVNIPKSPYSFQIDNDLKLVMNQLESISNSIAANTYVNEDLYKLIDKALFYRMILK